MRSISSSREIERRFPGIPEVTTTGLASLRDDPDFLEPLALYWVTAEFPRAQIVDVVERHLGATLDRAPRDLATRSQM